MRSPKINLTDEFLDRQNQKAQAILKKIDPSKITESSEIQRKNKNFCKACFYGPPKIVLQAFWQSNCVYCDEDMTFPNSDISLSCEKCAKEESVCSHCCANID